MPAHRTTLVALIAGAVALVTVDAAVAQDSPKKQPKPLASPCQTPTTGFQSCLRVLYKAADNGTADNVRATATLLLRVDACPANVARRRVVISRGGDRLAAARRPGSCRKGIVTWRARFPASATAAWALKSGDTVAANWSGVRNAASVAIRG